MSSSSKSEPDQSDAIVRAAAQKRARDSADNAENAGAKKQKLTPALEALTPEFRACVEAVIAALRDGIHALKKYFESVCLYTLHVPEKPVFEKMKIALKMEMMQFKFLKRTLRTYTFDVNDKERTAALQSLVRERSEDLGNDNMFDPKVVGEELEKQVLNLIRLTVEARMHEILAGTNQMLDMAALAHECSSDSDGSRTDSEDEGDA